MRRESPICDWRARTRYRPNEPARWLFFDIGIYAFLHVPLLFLAASVICVSAKTGGTSAVYGTHIFSTSSCSRGHLLHPQHRDDQLLRRLRRALSFMDTF